MSHWWEYYKFKSEPFLDQSPLTDAEDLNMFLGRVDELISIKMRADTSKKACLLITGDPGIGKTSFLCKAFEKDRGFVRVNLSKVKKADEVDGEIARALVFVLKKFKLKAEDLNRRIKQSTSKTTGRSLKAAPGGTGIESINQMTETLERNYEIEDVIKSSCERLASKTNRIVLGIDESDFLKDEEADRLSALCQRLKDLIPNPGVLILVNRDSSDEFGKAFMDPTSLARSTFEHLEPLESLWKPGEGEMEIMFEERFRRGKPSKSFKFPLSKDACFWINALSSGNMRELLRYTKHILIEGVREKVRVPIPAKFARDRLLGNYPELRITDEKDVKVLSYLKKKPTFASDSAFTKEVGESRTSIRRRLAQLEKHWLVQRDEVKTGQRHTYQITKKADFLLNTWT